MTLVRKQLTGLKVKDAAAGTVQAVFATMNVIDKDGDVTLPGAFADGEKVRISAYNHKSWDGALPVGRGEIHEQGDLAIFDGKFFMDTTAGRETFIVVKELGELCEWSYGYDEMDSSDGVFGPDDRKVHFLRSLKVHEVSPVILGAGIDTRTIAAKAAKQLQSDLFRRLRDAGSERWGGADRWVYVEDFDIDASWAVFVIDDRNDACRHVRVSYMRADTGAITLDAGETEVQPATTYNPKRRKLHEHAGAVLTALDELVDRVGEVHGLRIADGKTLGADTQAVLERYEVTMKRLRDVLTTEPRTNGLQTDLARESARYERLRATLSR